MRLFVALDLPAEVRPALAAVEVGEGWRRVPEQSLHVTLAFLGSLDATEAVIGAVRGAMRPVSRLSLDASLLLPPRRPRVLAVRLAGEVGELQASLSGALAGAGLYTPERRRFLPHVTIGRARGDGPSRELPAVPSLSFAAPSVSVYSSVLSPKGARYSALASFPVITVASDPASLRAVRLAALADSPGSFRTTVDEEEAQPPSWYEDLAARSAAGVTARVFHAPGGQGMVGAVHEGDEVHLWGMWVAPSARGRGVGRALVSAVVEWARSVGAARVELSVRDGLPAPAALYAAAGFEPTGRHEGDEAFLALRLR